jgi:hypothetical protein
MEQDQPPVETAEDEKGPVLPAAEVRAANVA